MRRGKMAAPCGTAKFREETSKKADSATRGRIAAVQNVGGRIVRLQVIFCNAAFANAGHGGCSTGSHPHLHSRKFRERRPHPATKAGCCRSGKSECEARFVVSVSRSERQLGGDRPMRERLSPVFKHIARDVRPGGDPKSIWLGCADFRHFTRRRRFQAILAPLMQSGAN